MSASTDRKAQQLGMPFGTATHRLRKLLMFDMAQRLHEDVCFRCGALIESATDLSVEHKVPWQGASNDLFFDLGNIAFSHLGCNSGAAAHTDVRGFQEGHQPWNKRPDKDGTAWCGMCQAYLPRQKFARNVARHNGLMDVCRTCRSKSR